MSDQISSDEFIALFKPHCINITRLVMGMTKDKFEEKTGINLDTYLDEILQGIYDKADDQPPSEDTS